MAKYKVFVSSPVNGLEAYREAIGKASIFGRDTETFEFFLFEHHENHRLPNKTVCESIFETSGIEFDAFLILFRERLGPGTIEELDAFEALMRPKNPNIDVWWSQIVCDHHDDDVEALLARLNQEWNTGMPCRRGQECLDHPKKLKARVICQMLTFQSRQD